MEKHPRITCEVCAQEEIVDTDNIRNIHQAIDLWICEHCAYVYSFISGHARQASQNARVQGDMEVLEKALIKMEKIGKMYPINQALPRINNKMPYCDRMDDLIVDDES